MKRKAIAVSAVLAVAGCGSDNQQQLDQYLHQCQQAGGQVLHTMLVGGDKYECIQQTSGPHIPPLVTI
jgi:Tfp pilus assembly protein PilP